MPSFQHAAATPTLLHQAHTSHLAATLTATFTDLMKELAGLQQEWHSLESLKTTLVAERPSFAIHAIGSLVHDNAHALIMPLHHAPGG